MRVFRPLGSRRRGLALAVSRAVAASGVRIDCLERPLIVLHLASPGSREAVTGLMVTDPYLS